MTFNYWLGSDLRPNNNSQHNPRRLDVVAAVAASTTPFTNELLAHTAAWQENEIV